MSFVFSFNVSLILIFRCIKPILFSRLCLSEIIVRPFISLMAKFEVCNVFSFLNWSISKMTYISARHSVYRYLKKPTLLGCAEVKKATFEDKSEDRIWPFLPSFGTYIAPSPSSTLIHPCNTKTLVFIFIIDKLRRNIE